MAVKKKKRTSKFVRFIRSGFFKVYILITILLIAAVFVGGSRLNTTLVEYEETLPVYAAESFKAKFDDRDFETIYSMDTARDNIGEGDRDFYMETMQELTAGKEFTMRERPTTRTDEKIYRVSMDGQPFADFKMQPGTQTTKHGYHYWEPVSVTTYVSAEIYVPEEVQEAVKEEVLKVYYTITAPENATVYINGNPLDSRYIEQSGISIYAKQDFLPLGIGEVRLNRYKYETSETSIDVRVVGPDGSDMEVHEAAARVWEVSVPTNDSLKGTYESVVIEIAQNLTMFTSDAIKAARMQGYCISKSPASELIRNFADHGVLHHKDARFKDIVTSDYRSYGDTCFTCRISYTFVRDLWDGSTREYPIAYTFCCGVKDGKVKLYNVDFN